MNDHDFKSLIEKVREQIDIVHVIGQRITLDHHYKALCPFHKEKTPSFSVNPRGRYFYCFGCGVGGDVFRFLELFENKPFMEVFSECANQVGISLSALTRENKSQIKEGRQIEDIRTETARFYHQSLTREVMDYLTKERKFNEETISRFLIGYANGGLREHLIDQYKFPLNLCLKAGVFRNAEAGSVRDYFYHRVIFPNIKRGRVVHLSGRSLDGLEPKYLHLPGEMSYLYNEDDLSKKEVYITEGIPDCLSAVQVGYPAVATLGLCNFKPEYLPKFSHCEKVYLCLDGDKAGKEGALKIGGLIGERARIVQLPEGYDLNEYLKNRSREDFKKLVASASDIIKYELSLIPPDTEKTELPRKLEPILKKLARMDKATAEAYLNYEIKPRFKLKKEDLDGYRDLVSKHRKENAEIPNIQTSKKDAEPVYTAHFDGLVDLVEYNDSPAFLIKKGNKLSIQSQVKREGILYIPPPKEQIPWLLPRGEEVVKYYDFQEVLSVKEIDGALYDDLLAYHKEISELPSDEHYDLIVPWDFHTYLLEDVQYSPIICLFAVPERGKSRTGKGMIYVAYRGIHVESLREAHIVRFANDLRTSICFDVKDIWKKAEKYRSEDILLQRFEKGATVGRVLYPERGPHQDIVYYSIFGPTVISTNQSVHRILETRAITINMPETSRRFENDVRPELSLPLKEQLVAFRARHLGESFPDIEKPASGRLGDILKPLQQIIRMVKPEQEPSFLRLVRELEAERLIEKADSLEAQLLTVIIELEDQMNRGILPVKTITDAFNESRSERSQLTYQKIGRRLSAMGFKKARAGNNAAILWEQEKIERMIDTYGLRQTHETQERDKTHT